MTSRVERKPGTRFTKRELHAISSALGYVDAGEWPFEDGTPFGEEDVRSAWRKVSERLRTDGSRRDRETGE